MLSAKGVLERIGPHFPGLDGQGALFCECWLGLLLDWNQKIDLTAARTADELLDLMLADAAVLSAHLAPGVNVLDVGAGAGAPGLALALFRPDVRVTLVEPMQKRVAFLNTVVGALISKGMESSRIRVMRDRVEHQKPRSEPGWVAISRATLSPADWLREGARLVPTGEVWVLLAKEAAPEYAGWSAVKDIGYAWPLSGAKRRALCYRPGAPI